jgi:2-keto-3-deoxy-L-rhamnonate aldolase RhmA
LKENELKKRLKAGEATVGSWLSVAHPTIAEVMGLAGFDWLAVDMEHGIVSLEGVQTLIQVLAGTPAAPLVRVPWNEPVVVKQVLEAGPRGIVFPQVNTAEQAQAAVRATKYPPEGIRGIGCQRAAGFGAWFDEYLRRANEEQLIIIQIEHIQAVENLESILEVAGLDVVFIGANDLSASMGLLGQARHPHVLEAISHILTSAKGVGVAAGLMASDADDANRRFAEGFQFVGIGHDVGLLSSTCRQVCSKVERQAIAATNGGS